MLVLNEFLCKSKLLFKIMLIKFTSIENSCTDVQFQSTLQTFNKKEVPTFKKKGSFSVLKSPFILKLEI